jgi:hypothetical protein
LRHAAPRGRGCVCDESPLHGAQRGAHVGFKVGDGGGLMIR